MLSPFAREKIENWASDFVSSDRLREAPASTHEHAAGVLVEFMAAACSPRERMAGDAGGFSDGRDHAIEPDEVEEADLKHALLNHVSRLNVPDSVKRDLPALCAAFLAQLEDDGRLGGGRMLGSYVRALKDTYAETASGKKKPITRPGSKIGRNDPCPCGSGKKYKQCCLRG